MQCLCLLESKGNGNVATSRFWKDINVLQCFLVLKNSIVTILKDPLFISAVRSFIYEKKEKEVKSMCLVIIVGFAHEKLQRKQSATLDLENICISLF